MGPRRTPPTPPTPLAPPVRGTTPRPAAGGSGSVSAMHFGSLPSVGVGELKADDFLLDVREDDEWQAGHIEGALHIPMSEFVARYGEVTEAAPQDGTVNVICRSGGR
ncbi:rhodanese domain-containing protein, partial [Streptomyces sp. SPB78]